MHGLASPAPGRTMPRVRYVRCPPGLSGMAGTRHPGGGAPLSRLVGSIWVTPPIHSAPPYLDPTVVP